MQVHVITAPKINKLKKGFPRCNNLGNFSLFCSYNFVRVRAFVLTSLFSLFYVTGEFHRFLLRGRAKKNDSIQIMMKYVNLYLDEDLHFGHINKHVKSKCL